MRLPAYWWLLALAVIPQAVFFLRTAILRMRRKGVQPLARPALATMVGGVVAGVTYGVLQRDPLFVLGQLCLLAFYCMIQARNDDTGK